MYRQYIKRPVDLVTAGTCLVLASPIYLVVYIGIKLTSEGPVIFVQERTGVNGKIFKMYKFRTMHVANNVHDTSTENSITNIGQILRALSLDEIPQLINVVKGDMSLIGPRPWIHSYYENMTPTQRKRVSVRPGITGLAQAYGRNNLSIHGKLEYDTQYVKKVTFAGDAKIVIKTIEALFKRTGQEISKFSISQEIETLRQQLVNEQSPGLQTELGGLTAQMAEARTEPSNVPEPSYNLNQAFYSEIPDKSNAKKTKPTQRVKR